MKKNASIWQIFRCARNFFKKTRQIEAGISPLLGVLVKYMLQFDEFFDIGSYGIIQITPKFRLHIMNMKGMANIEDIKENYRKKGKDY